MNDFLQVGFGNYTTRTLDPRMPELEIIYASQTIICNPAG